MSAIQIMKKLKLSNLSLVVVLQVVSSDVNVAIETRTKCPNIFPFPGNPSPPEIVNYDNPEQNEYKLEDLINKLYYAAQFEAYLQLGKDCTMDAQLYFWDINGARSRSHYTAFYDLVGELMDEKIKAFGPIVEANINLYTQRTSDKILKNSKPKYDH